MQDFEILCPDCTVEPNLRGHPNEKPPPLERPLDNVNLNINVLISTPDERPLLLKGAKGVASQEGFHCILFSYCHIACFRSPFGREYEVAAHYYLDSHKAEKDVHHWMITMGVPGSDVMSVQAPTENPPPEA